MKHSLTSLFAISGLALLGTSTTALAQSTGLEDMVGARAGQAEGELQRRGWRNVRAERGDDRSYTYWWNDDRRQCVSIATMNGRYDSVTVTPAPDCRQSANDRPRPDYDRPRPGDGNRPQPGYDRDPGNGPPPYRPGGDRPSVLPGGTIVGGQSVDLGLVCFGDGQRDTVTSGTRWTWNPRRDRYDYDRTSELTSEQFDATVTIQLWDGGGRIRLPKSLIPPLNSRGSNGWWELDNVSTGRDQITATYRLNGLNKPRITIDRRRGRINIQGTSSYGFRGECDLIGDDTRRF